MATLSIQLSGSAVVNGTKTYTVSDPDIQDVLTWAATAFATSLPASPTNQQILLAWIQQQLVVATQTGVQRFETTTTVPPAPVFT